MKSSTIGELAERFGLATHVLRHWESMGLLTPTRDAGGQRRYGEHDTGNPMDQEALLRRHLTVLERRIADATAAKELIEHALSCPIPFDECPHAQARITERTGQPS